MANIVTMTVVTIVVEMIANKLLYFAYVFESLCGRS